MKKKILIFAAVLCLLIVFFAFPASAEEGTLGSNIAWTFDNGTLTISGSGAMATGSPYPWSQYSSTTTTLIISPGITSIGRSAFSNFSALTSISLPSTLTSIGTDAFLFCSRLTSVTIPDSVTSLDSRAFGSCSRLTSVQLSRNLKVLGDNAFNGCSGLTQITIPDSVTAIEGYAFSGCSSLQSIHLGAGISSIEETAFWQCPNLKAFTISPNNPYFTADNGFIYNKSKTQLLRGPQGYQGSYAVLPGTTKITAYACYECSGITNLIIPNSVTAIEEYAFVRCTGLKSVSLSNALSTIGLYGFAFCSSLTEITFPASLTKLGQQAFQRCSSLKDITFLGMAPKIGDLAFGDVTATVYYPAHKAGWKDSKKLYGGKLKWTPLEIDCNGAHTPTAIATTTPTCEAPGSKGGTMCTACGEILEQPTVIPAAGHKFGDWSLWKKPTETEPGKIVRVCNVCNFIESKQITSMDEYQPAPTEPPATKPPATEPPVTKPPVTNPPATEPPVIGPPVTDPSITEPPATEPPVTEPLATKPLVTEPPVTEPGPVISTPPNTPSDTTSENPEGEESDLRIWVIGISATVVVIAAIAATAVAIIQKKK